MLELIVLHKVAGILKMIIEYVGMACATILINTSRPAFKIYFSFHPRTLFFNLFPKVLERVNFWSSLNHWQPKIFSQSFIILPPIKPCISYLTSALVFRLKKIDVFLSIYSLAWSHFISPKKVREALVFLCGSLTKDKAIICK